MSQDCSSLARCTVEITNALGLHLRPAHKFVTTADRYKSEIRVRFNGHDFDGKSILDLTGLAAEKGSRLDLEAYGPDAEAALSALARLIESEFYEDENGDERPQDNRLNVISPSGSGSEAGSDPHTGTAGEPAR